MVPRLLPLVIGYTNVMEQGCTSTPLTLPIWFGKARVLIANSFSAAHRISDALEAIPLTGHTFGFTAYRLVHPEGVFLFIGDFLVPKGGVWVANSTSCLCPWESRI
jgi:hypothetical protein